MNKPKTGKDWQTSQRVFDYSKRVLIMGILNVTPDSFSDGGRFAALDDALKQAEKLINEGADILDIGGESTRPKSERVSSADEIKRVVPVIESIKKRFEIAVSVDTSKGDVAKRAIEAGAEIINDVSGLRFDKKIAEIAASTGAGLVLMHLSGDFETMHSPDSTINIVEEVSDGFEWSLETAKKSGVSESQICLDVGIGFSKTQDQNLELIAKFGEISRRFPSYPLLIGTSRKSFIARILDGASVDRRLVGTIAANALAVTNGANIIRVHDVKENREAMRVLDAIAKAG